MNRRLFIALLFFPYLILTQISAQDSFFEKLYHNSEILYTVQQTTDDGFIISGLRPLNAGNHVLLMKVDSNGDTIWTQDYAGMGEADYYRTAAIQSTDGGYVLTGTTQDTEKSDVFVVKTDTRGETVWQKTYEDSLEEKSWSIQNTLDGGYLIDAKREINKIHLIKIDSIGQVDWESELGPILAFDLRKQVIQTADSGYVIVSRSEMYKLSQNGESLWAKSFDVRFYLIQELTDRSLIVAGRDILFKTNSEGEQIWRQELEFNPNDLLITENEDIILIGDKMILLDGAGTEIWSVQLNGEAQNVVQTDDGFVLCGNLPDALRNQNGWLIKTKPDGFYKSLTLMQPKVLSPGKIQIFGSYEIKWRSHNVQKINIEFSPNNGIAWDLIATDYLAAENVYRWNPGGPPTSEGLIKISDTAHPDFSDQTQDPFLLTRDYDYIAINDIKMYFSKYGSGSNRPGNDGPGLFWPGGENGTKTAVFQDGLIWAGKVNGLVQANGNNHKGAQQPGVIFPDGSTGNPDSTLYSIWKIRYDWGVFPPGWVRDRLEYDYKNWPVEIGAPWIDINQDGIFDPDIDQPKLYGDETNWFVMNDVGEPPSIWRLYGSGEIGLEIQCTIYGYDREDALVDVVFKKYRMINKGQNLVEDMYFGYWSDPDLGDAQDDFIGCDTLLNLAYCYNADNSDGDGTWNDYWGTYGLSPPAVGYILIQGPIVPSFPSDSAYLNDQWITGYTNQGMTSFYLYINADNTYSDPVSGHPLGGEEVYNNLQGLNWNENPIIHPHSGETTTFVLTGDPIAESGWYEGAGWPGGFEPDDRRMQIGTGPFDFAPGDTQEIAIAIVLAQGEDHLDSVTKLKEKAAAVRQFYYTGTLSGIRHPASPHPASFRLEQNYPNPFNPKTIINYQLPITNKIDLSIYNLLGQKVVTLVSEKQKAGFHRVEWDASRFASGVYFYILRTGDYRDVKKMVLLR